MSSNRICYGILLALAVAWGVFVIADWNDRPERHHDEAMGLLSVILAGLIRRDVREPTR